MGGSAAILGVAAILEVVGSHYEGVEAIWGWWPFWGAGGQAFWGWRPFWKGLAAIMWGWQSFGGGGHFGEGVSHLGGGGHVGRDWWPFWGGSGHFSG